MGNCPSGISDSDVKDLIMKMCSVNEVYIPPRSETGMLRKFAIVEIGADMNVLRQCLQVYNNTHWKGAKIRVEIAKTYYLDRLRKERESIQETPLDPMNNNEPVPVFSGGLLKLKRSLGEMMTVNCTPAGDSSDRDMSKRKKLIPRATRVVFDATGNISTEINMSTHVEDSNSQIVKLDLAPKQNIGSGGGKRVGFGFGLEKKIAPKAADCCLDGTVDILKGRNKHMKNNDLFQNKLQRDVLEDYYEFAERIAEVTGDGDLVEESVFVPSLTEAEVEESALRAERQRLLNMFMHIRESKKNSTASSQEETNENIAEPRLYEISSSKSRSSWNDISIARYDPMEVKSAQYLADKNIVSDNLSSSKTSMKDEEVTLITAKGSAGILENYADLGVLKNIFQKDVSL